MASYSGTPLQKKLGIKPGMRAAFLSEPSNYRGDLGKLPADLRVLTRLGRDMNFVHLFCKSIKDMKKRLPAAKNSLAKDGILWVSWVKKSSGIKCDLGEADVRREGLRLKLVDVKICAIDDKWSGLKFVYRLRDR